ncbi:MAG: hypothetical protein AAB221_12930, partial [Bacteroidota bacterium]
MLKQQDPQQQDKNDKKNLPHPILINSIAAHILVKSKKYEVRNKNSLRMPADFILRGFYQTFTSFHFP